MLLKINNVFYKNLFKLRYLLVVILLSLNFSNIFHSENVLAASSNNEKSQQIQDDTIITNDNIDDVCIYLGLKPSDFIKTDVDKSKETVQTVGELKAIINQVKKSSETNNQMETNSEMTTNILKTNNENESENYVCRSKPRGTITLFHNIDCDGYSITCSVSGQYYGSEWIGASDASVSVDSNQLLIIQKVEDNPSLSATYTSDCITLKVKCGIGFYVGVDNMGLVRIDVQDVDSTSYFYADDWI